MTTELIQTPMLDEQPIKKKINIKEMLTKKLNEKIKIAGLLIIFCIFNRMIGFFTDTQFGLNLLLIIIAIFIISIIDGVFKYNEK